MIFFYYNKKRNEGVLFQKKKEMREYLFKNIDMKYVLSKLIFEQTIHYILSLKNLALFGPFSLQ
jgi:hypothetical protein